LQAPFPPQVRPSRAWRDVLLDPQATAWLTELMPRLASAASAPALAATSRQLLVRLAAVSGDIFVPSPAGTASFSSYSSSIACG